MAYTERYKKVLAEIERVKETLKLEDFNLFLRIKDEDGSYFELEHATYREFEDYILVFTEHTIDHAFRKPDLAWMKSEDMWEQKRQELAKYVVDNRYDDDDDDDDDDDFVAIIKEEPEEA